MSRFRPSTVRFPTARSETGFGKFLLTGDADKATITVQGTVPEVLVELDRDGDDTIDSTATYTWEELVF